jgi:hypothetical protein
MAQLDKLIEQAPKIIAEAARNPLGIIALIIFALSLLALGFFSNSEDSVKVGIFVVLVLSFGVCTYVAASVPPRLETLEKINKGMGAWHNQSIEKLKNEQKKNVSDKKLQDIFIKEISKRDGIMDKFKKNDGLNLLKNEALEPSDISGEWSVVGYNPHTQDENYYGILTIEKDNNVLRGDWRIVPGEQHHIGIGFIKNEILAFTFSYSEENPQDAGVVVYEMLTNNVMRGIWTGYGANNLGFEECRKISI